MQFIFRPRESLLHFHVNILLLHLAALFDGLTRLLLTVVLQTEGGLTMRCLHVLLFCLVNQTLRPAMFSARLIQAAVSTAFVFSAHIVLC